MFNNTTNIIDQSTVRIVKLVMKEVSGFHNQYTRPFQVNLTPRVLGDIQRKLETGINDVKINAKSLHGVTHEFITPSAGIESTINIPNGWMNTRFIFMMEIEYNNSLGVSSDIICGFTDYAGYSNLLNRGLQLDKKMNFIINSITPVRHITVNTHTGAICKSLVNPPVYMNNQVQFDVGDTSIYRATPSSVFNNMSLNEYRDALGAVDIYDSSTSVNGGFTTPSYRSNANPVVFTAKVMDNYKNALVSSNDFGKSSELKAILQEARKTCEEPAIMSINTMKLLQNIQQGIINIDFTIQDLEAITPNVEDVTTVILKDPRKDMIPIDYSEHLAGSDLNTLAAVIISNMLPTIMSGFGIAYLSFSSTNRIVNCGYDSPIKTIITGSMSFSERQPQIDKITISNLIAAIDFELIQYLSYNGEADYDLTVECDLFTETKVTVSYSGRPAHTYTIPTFADSTFNSCIMTNNDNLRELNRSLIKLVGVVEDVLNQPGKTTRYIPPVMPSDGSFFDHSKDETYVVNDLFSGWSSSQQDDYYDIDDDDDMIDLNKL